MSYKKTTISHPGRQWFESPSLRVWASRVERKDINYFNNVVRPRLEFGINGVRDLLEELPPFGSELGLSWHAFRSLIRISFANVRFGNAQPEYDHPSLCSIPGFVGQKGELQFTKGRRCNERDISKIQSYLWKVYKMGIAERRLPIGTPSTRRISGKRRQRAQMTRPKRTHIYPSPVRLRSPLLPDDSPTSHLRERLEHSPGWASPVGLSEYKPIRFNALRVRAAKDAEKGMQRRDITTAEQLASEEPPHFTIDVDALRRKASQEAERDMRKRDRLRRSK